MHEVRHYLTPAGKDVFMEWWNRLRDHKARRAIDRRVNRIKLGNFGDHKYLQHGVSELRIDVGPGYRVYYAAEGKQIIILLCAGDKSTQSEDINRACANWREWQSRDQEEQE